MNKETTIQSLHLDERESNFPTTNTEELIRIHQVRAKWILDQKDGIAPGLKKEILNEIGLSDYAQHVPGSSNQQGSHREILDNGMIVDFQDNAPKRQINHLLANDAQLCLKDRSVVLR